MVTLIPFQARELAIPSYSLVRLQWTEIDIILNGVGVIKLMFLNSVDLFVVAD